MFTNVVLERNDDNHAGPYDIGPLTSNLLAEIGFPINFYGTYYTNLWVNNNGNVTFDSRFDHFAPDELVTFGVNIIAPFWADVDTPSPNSAQVTYGTNAVDGHNAFGVNWINVGYFGERADKLLIAQLVLINRSDIASGDFDMEFNYDKVEWEWGTASANDPPRAGFSNATNSFELPASGVTGAFLDSNPATGLIYNSLESPISGRYRFLFRSGQPL
jgi:hypothetical protein